MKSLAWNSSNGLIRVSCPHWRDVSFVLVMCKLPHPVWQVRVKWHQFQVIEYCAYSSAPLFLLLLPRELQHSFRESRKFQSRGRQMLRVEVGSIILGTQFVSLIRILVVIHFIYHTKNFWTFINSASWTSKSWLSVVEKNMYEYKEIHKYFEFIKLYRKICWWLNLSYPEVTGIK